MKELLKVGQEVQFIYLFRQSVTGIVRDIKKTIFGNYKCLVEYDINHRGYFGSYITSGMKWIKASKIVYIRK